jgi:chromosome segregation and condensation protein ScpB
VNITLNLLDEMLDHAAVSAALYEGGEVTEKSVEKLFDEAIKNSKALNDLIATMAKTYEEQYLHLVNTFLEHETITN